MARASLTGQIFRFGLFEADPSGGTLSRKGVRIKIQDQPFRVLILLLERAGEIIGRDEMRQELWPEGTYVDFDGSLNVILKKLRAALEDDSENPRFIETIPRRGYRFIAPVAVVNNQQSATPATAVETPVPAPTGLPSQEEPRPATRSPYLLYALAGGILVLLVGGSLIWRWHRPPVAETTQQSNPVPMRRSIAVLGFQNISGSKNDEWLATAFSEMLSTELAAGDRLRIVSGEDVANLRISSPWSPSGTLDRATTSRVGAALSSDLLVLGSYTMVTSSQGGHLRLDVRMQDAQTGEILTEMAEIGNSGDLFQVVSRVGDKLRDRLGIPTLEPSDEASLLAVAPLDHESARFYALGVKKMREFDWLAAKDLLEQASRLDPKFPLIHLNLSIALGRLGYQQKSKDEAKKALDLSSTLQASQRLLVEGTYYDSIADHDKAISTYHALFQLFPDSVDYGLLLTYAQVAASLNSEAANTIAQLRRLPPPASDDPRIDLADIHATAKNDPERLVLIRRAVSKAQAQGKRLLYARARKEECVNLIYGEHPDQGPPACQEAYGIFMASGNHLEAADATRMIGDYQGAQGHMDEAIATYQKALNILQDLGDHHKTGAVLNNMAINYANEGKIDRAEQLYRQAKTHFEQAGDKALTALTIGNIADILFLRGDLPGADQTYQESLHIEESLDNGGSPGYILSRLSDLALTQGHPEQAKGYAEKAIESLRPNQGGYQYTTGAMISLGEALKTLGDLPGARKQFEESLAIRQKLGQADLVGETNVELADLAIDEGHADQAEPLLRAAIQEFEKDKSYPDPASAYAILSRAFLASNKVSDARKAIDRAAELVPSDPNPALKLQTAIGKARVEMAESIQSGVKPKAAEQELRAAVALAGKLGFYSLESEGRLALGELDVKANPSSGRTELAALADTSRKRGLELIAHRAEQAVVAPASSVASAQPVH